MIGDKRCINVKMSAVKDIIERLNKAKFCYNECPVPIKNAFLGCTSRPVEYMKECPRLKEHLKKEKRNNDRQRNGR